MPAKRKKANIAVAAGLTAALAVGQVPAVAFAEASSEADDPIGESRQDAASKGGEAAADSTAAPGNGETAAAATLDGGVPSEAETSGTEGAPDDQPAAEDQKEASIVGLTSPQAETVAEGAVALPTTVLAAFDDSSVADVPVTWSLDGVEATSSLLANLGVGTYEFTGVVAGSDLTASCTVQVVAASPSAQSQPAANAAANDAARQNIETGEHTWTYDITITMPTGFDPALFLQNEGYHGYRFVNEAGEVEWISPHPEDPGFNWDLSSVDASVPGSYETTFTIPEWATAYSDLGGMECTATIVVSDALELPTTITDAQGVQDVPDEPEYFMPYIPDPVVYLEDGSFFNAYVDWDQDDVLNLALHLNEPGTYTVRGTYRSCPTQQVTATIWIQGIRSIDREQVYTEPGKAPVMPESVYVEYENGSRSSVAVTWDAIDPAQYDENGFFEVVGTVPNTDIKAVAEVYVSPLKSMTTPRVVVPVGSSMSDVYEGVNLVYEYGTDWVNPVWERVEEGDPRLAQPGTFQIHGALEGYDIDFVCDVVVIGVENYQSEYNVSTAPGLLNLPYEVTVDAADGVQEIVHINWEWPDLNEYDHVGTFDVKGTLEGTDLPVTAHVSVLNVTDVSNLKETYSTVEGVQPDLPDYAELVLEDGSTVSTGISWDMPTPDAFVSGAGPITVKGRVNGPETPVQVTVEVLWTQPVREVQRVSTLVGIAPALPYSIEVTMSDGSVQNLRVQWETALPSQYAQAGTTFELSGYVAGSSYPVEASVSVCNPADEPMWSEIIAEGDVPRYSDHAYDSVKLDNGDSVYVGNGSRLTWDEPDPSVFTAGETVRINGQVLGCPEPVYAEVSVVKVLQLQSSEYQVDYLIGSSESLQYMIPQVAYAYAETGEAVYVSIEWEDVPAEVLTTPGTYTLNGTAAGMPVTCKIRAMKAVSAELTEPIVTIVGKIPEEQDGYSLQAVVKVDDGSGEEGAINRSVWNVSWDIDDEAVSTPGTYKIKGTTTAFGGKVQVTATLQVYAKVVSVEELTAWTLPDSYPNLPYQVDVTFAMPSDSPVSGLANLLATGNADDTVTVSMPVRWDNYNSEVLFSKENLGKTVTIKGSIPAIDYPVECAVDVTTVNAVTVPSISTAVGSAPELPSRASVELASGMVATAYVQWNANYDYDLLDQPGATFMVEGSAYVSNGGDSWTYPVSCQVTVEGVQSVPDEAQETVASVAAEVGQRPQLPAILPVELSSGAVQTASVAWDWASVDESLFSQVGAEFDVTGTIVGMGSEPVAGLLRLMRASAPNQVTAHVTMVGDGERQVSFIAPEVETVSASAVKADDVLPEATNVTLSDGSVETRAVDWDTSGIDLSQPGTYKVEGSVEGSDKPAYAFITVTKADQVRRPSSVQPVKISIPLPENGLTLNELSLQLPLNAIVNYTIGDSEVLPVRWDLSGVRADDLKKPGTITVQGSIDGVADLKAEAEITLTADEGGSSAMSPVEPVEVTTFEGHAPTLPETVAFTMPSGSIQELPVKWEKPKPEDYGKQGTFTIYGVVEDSGIEIKAEVIVNAYVPIAGIELSVQEIEMMDKGALRLEQGGIAHLSASITPEDSSYRDVTFTSTNPDVVQVDADGTVKAIANSGVAYITATADGREASIRVVVGAEPATEVPVASVEIVGEGVSNGVATVTKGATLSLSTKVSPADASNLEVSWSSSNPAVASVGGDGVVRALKGGTTVISAQTKNGVTASITVRVPRTLESSTLQILVSSVPVFQVGATLDPSVFDFRLMQRYDDGSVSLVDVLDDQVTVSGFDSSKAGACTLVAALKANPTVTCSFQVTIQDKTDGTVVKPGTGDPDGGNDADDDGTDNNGTDPNDEGSKDPGEVKPLNTAEKADGDGLAQTGDPMGAVAAGGAAGGVLALIGAWFARRRGRNE